MGHNIAKKTNTDMQNAFLEALFLPDVRGNLREAMNRAGYSEKTSIKEVVEPLKDQIVELSQSVLAMNAAKATIGMLEVIDSPQQVGAANKLKAAESVLDRVGVIKKDGTNMNLPQGAIVFLPPKENVKISIENTGPQTIDITPKVIDQKNS